MNQHFEHDPGWTGWKSAVLMGILLYALFRFLPIKVEVTGGALVAGGPMMAQAGATGAGTNAEGKKEGVLGGDYFGGLDEEVREEMIEEIEWETNDDYPFPGDPDAKKGGKFRMAGSNFVPTLRTEGKDASDAQLTMIQGLVYQTLLSLNSDPFYYYPSISDKWAIGEDKQTYYYHINELAKWADGKPLRAQDVVATYDLVTSKDIQAPGTSELWKKFERPVALSDQVVMVKSKELQWRNHITFSTSFFIYPSHVLEKITAKEYMKKYNWKMLVGSGPYTFDKVVKPKKISYKRRANFWGASEREFTGLYNFDIIEFLFVKDPELVYEKFKAGEFDYMPIYRSARWVKETNFDKVQNGWVQKKKVFNRNPQGRQGFHFNMRDEPFNDVKIRKAFAFLWNRGLLMEQIMFNEYGYMDSFFQNSPYMGDTPNVRYNPDTARELLAEAGWTERNDEGVLVKDGKPFELELTYYNKWSEKFYTVYQEDLMKVGVKLNLKQITWATHIKRNNERNFKLTAGAYVGLTFPNPESTFHSKFADQKASGNMYGIKNKRVDEIIEAYNDEFDYEKRVELLKELDTILTNLHLMAFDWYAPAERLIYWNKFGLPKGVISKTGDYRDAPVYWWYDEYKAKALEKAMANDTSLPITKVDNKFWIEEGK